MEGLIELENPNRVKQKMKKVSQLDDPTLGAAPAAAAAAAAPAKKAAPGDAVFFAQSRRGAIPVSVLSCDIMKTTLASVSNPDWRGSEMVWI